MQKNICAALVAEIFLGTLTKKGVGLLGVGFIIKIFTNSLKLHVKEFLFGLWQKRSYEFMFVCPSVHSSLCL